MTVVDGIEIMTMNQLKTYRTNVEREKMKRSNAFNATVFKGLIGRVTPHAMWKMHKQWKLYKAATPHESLGPCTKVFRKTMGLPCAHRIKESAEHNEGFGQLHIDYVHPHWRFKKPSIEEIETHRESEDNELRDDGHVLAEMIEEEGDELRIPEDDDNEWREYDHSELRRIIEEGFNNIIERPEDAISDASSEADLIVQDMEDDNHIEPPIEEHDSAEDELANGDLLDVNDPEKVKAKGRPKGAKGKKPLMTKAQKKVVKSTRRDPSKFEHVEQRLQATRHQQGNVTQRSELGQGRQSQRGQRGKGRGGRGGRGLGNKGRGGGQRGGGQDLHAFEEEETQHQGVYTGTRQRGGGGARGRELRGGRQEVRRGKTSSAPISVSSFEASSLEASDLDEDLNMSVG